MEAFSEAIKVFLDKRLIPTVAALVIGTVAYCIIPENNYYLCKLGREWFILLVAGGAFLIITLCANGIQRMNIIWSASKNKKYSKQREEEKINRSMRTLWDRVDEMCLEDRQLLETFLETGNKPMVRQGGFYCGYDRLLGSNLIKCREATAEGRYVKQYILEESFYNMLKYSKEKYGRISNFSEEG